MPNTITTFPVFTAGTKARASEVNAALSNFRGTLLPINTDTATASDASHDLGASGHQWKDIYYSGNLIQDGITAGAIPVGSVIMSAVNSAPAQYLLCDGSSVARSTYESLFNALSIETGGAYTLPSFGYETSTHFNLPDLRGKFARFVDGGAGNDPDAGSRTAQGTNGSTGDSIGSMQADASAPNGLSTTSAGSHTHNFITRWGGTGSRGAWTGPASAGIANQSSTITETFMQAAGSHVHGLTGDNETRPLNLNLKAYIKY